MRPLWPSSKTPQPQRRLADQPGLFDGKPVVAGEPLWLPLGQIDEGLDNPRTEFPDDEINELADDIRERGLLQPIVVDAADATGRYRVRFGAKRLRAAKLVGLQKVPVTIGTRAFDGYALVAENQKRHGLSPLDLARFIGARVEGGESQATVAKRLGMDQTSVAHHLALLSLPPVLIEALKSGRCTSPRSLYELSKLNEDHPERVAELISGESEITRSAIAALRMTHSFEEPPRAVVEPRRMPMKTASLIERANKLSDRLNAVLEQLTKRHERVAPDELAALRQRLAALVEHLDA